MTFSIRRVAITGGGGFIGSALTRNLLGRGIAVNNLDYLPNKFTHPLLVHFQGSFLDHGLVREAISGVDCVFHLAATGFSHEANANPVRDVEENIVGTLKLLEIASELKVARMVFCSSGGTIYGPTDQVPIQEETATNPVSAYGISKLACEKYMRLFDATNPSGVGNGVMTTLSLRVSNPYGADQNISKAQGALVTFCHRTLNNEPIVIWGDGTIERDYIDVRDVAEALYLAGSRTDVSSREINIGSGQPTSLINLLDMISAVLNRRPVVDFQKGRGFDVPRNYLDISAAQTLLNWSPRIDLQTGITELLTEMQARRGQFSGRIQ